MTEETTELIESEQTPPQRLFPRKESTELRLTVVESVYYQQPGADSVQIEAGYTYFVQENEQIFKRITFADVDWKPLETGWVKKASCVVIQNVHQVETRRKLTEEEALDASKHLIQVRFEDSQHWFELRVKESMRFKPSDVSKLLIRSAYELTRYTAYLIPE